MSAMTNFTVKSLRANKVRTLVTIGGVALAAALLTAVLTSYVSLQSLLYRSTQETSGAWMAMVCSDVRGPLEADAVAAQAAGSIDDVAFLQDIGFGELTEAQQDIYGRYLPIAALDGDVEALCALRPSEGRLPQSSDEVLLFDVWRTSGGLSVGDTLTLPVGQRVAERVPGGDSSAQGVLSDSSDLAPEDVRETGSAIEEGSVLDSSIGYLEAEVDGGSFNERLVDPETRTYTVVGFYDRSFYAASRSVGMTGFTGTAGVDPNAEGLTRLYVTMSDVSSTDAVKARATAAFPDADVRLHADLLRYMGVRSGGTIWNTFFGLVAVLATVIVIACVSLIYNAFAISVAERTSQFGLLASVGASRRQLRRAVVLEAIIVALVGVPLGLLVGIGGCAVTFAFVGPSLSAVMGVPEVPFVVAIAPWALVFAAGLTVATVLFSVFVPAWRASRVSVVEAMRGIRAGRVSKRGAAAAAKAVVPGKLWKPRGAVDRAFGVGGALARINAKRGTGRGTTASVSLALAIVLLMTAGSLSLFLGKLANVAGGDVAMPDVAVHASFEVDVDENGVVIGLADAAAADAAAGDAAADDAATDTTTGDTAGEDAASRAASTAAGNGLGASDAAATVQAGVPDSPAGSISPDDAVAAANARFAEEAELFAAVYEELLGVPDAIARGWMLHGRAPVVVPESMAAEAVRKAAVDGGPLGDGAYGVMADLTFLDDATFDAYAAECGLDAAAYHDPAHPRAIGVAEAYGNDGNVYQLLRVFQEPGEVSVWEGGMAQTEEGETKAILGFSAGFGLNRTSADDEPTFEFIPFCAIDGDGYSTNGDAGKASVVTSSLEVAALASEAPSSVGNSGGVQIVVPMSLATTTGFGITAPYFRAAFDAEDNQHAEVAQELVNVAGTFLHDHAAGDLAYLSMSDYVESAETNRMLVMVINVFCLLFSVILALIALANVFNTVTNGLILRRREFAVMKSVGMSNRQFRRMVTDECLGFGLRGFVPGFLVSIVVSWLLYCAITNSMSGLMFSLPWAYVALALGMTAIAMIASVAYGMHRCKADNVVEALRADNV